MTSVREVPSELRMLGADQRRATLTALVGPRAGETFSLARDFSTIGRMQQCHITLAEHGVSRVHARIGRADGGYYIEDLQSTNGTYVDGIRLTEPVWLQEGAHIVVGAATAFRFALLDPVAEAASHRMYEATVRDPLTGLYNRRYLDERLAEEFASSVRYDTALCVMVLDIDHFKLVNDRHGHAKGDAALCKVAETLRSAVRSDDLVARSGGEEFVLVARHIDPQASRMLAERVRAAVAAQRVPLDEGELSVTISIGLAHTDSELLLSRPESLLQAADEALYRAKGGGRDRVCCAMGDTGLPSSPALRSSQRPGFRRPRPGHAATTVELERPPRQR